MSSLNNRLLAPLAAYAAASLVHHAHNAHFIAAYPNLPASLSAPLICVAWLLATAVGIAGYVLLRRGHRWLGACALLAYGAYGLDALLHYRFAPLAAHTLAMNATILLEAATAAVLIVWTVCSLRSAR